MAKDQTIRATVNDLWQQAVEQLEEVKDVLMRSRGKLEDDLFRLRKERDRLLKLLGEQTYKLANQGKLPVPSVVRRTVDRLNDVIESLMAQESTGARGNTTRPSSAAASVQKPVATKSSTTKSSKKTPRKATKKTAKKKVSKKKATRKRVVTAGMKKSGGTKKTTKKTTKRPSKKAGSSDK